MSISVYGRRFRSLAVRRCVRPMRRNAVLRWAVRQLPLLAALSYVGTFAWLPYEPPAGDPAARVRLDDTLEVNMDGVWLRDRG